jgi:hypothetical protein
MSIHESLNLLGQAAEKSIPALNYGGCCVFAAEVGKALKAKGIPVRGVARPSYAFWEDEAPDLRRIEKQMGDNSNAYDWEDAGADLQHVGLQVKLGRKWYNYDSEGLSPDLSNLRGRPAYSGHLSVKALDKLAAVPDNWNRAFNRKRGVPAIKRLVREYLEE